MKLPKTLKLPVPGVLDQMGQSKGTIIILKISGLLALLAFALVFPPLISVDTAMTGVAVYVLMFAAWATAWNIFSGYSGYIALGHATFFGSGAYALGVMCKHWNVGSS